MARARTAHPPDTTPSLRAKRVTALDVARGLFLIASVTLSAVLPPRAGWLAHAVWDGVTLYDLTFPLFVSLSGVGLAFAYCNDGSGWVTARRVVVLAAAGLAYTAIAHGGVGLSTFRLTGPLQVYAVLVLVVALLHTVLRTARGWAVVTFVTAAGLSAFLVAWAASRRGSTLTPECNPSRVLDGALLGAHMYAGGERGRDPEGVVAMAGVFVTAAAGVTAGHLLLRYRSAWRLVVWAVAIAAGGLALATLLEPMKRLWTPPFALLTGALGVAIVAFVVFDRSATGRWDRLRARVASPLVALGRNSLLVYSALTSRTSCSSAAPVTRSSSSPSWWRLAGFRRDGRSRSSGSPHGGCSLCYCTAAGSTFTPDRRQRRSSLPQSACTSPQCSAPPPVPGSGALHGGAGESDQAWSAAPSVGVSVGAGAGAGSGSGATTSNVTVSETALAPLPAVI